MTMRDITLGSMSPIKLASIREACRKAGLACAVRGVATESGVPAQPVGYAEMLAGATRRAKEAQAAHPANIAVGIENGIEETGGVWTDIAIVVILLPDGDLRVARSRAVVVPRRFVDAVLADPERRRTAGSFIANELGGDPTDPHAALTGGRETRQALLTETLHELFSGLKG